MRFYHSVAIKIEKVELLEVLGLKKILNILGDVNKTPLC